MCEPTLDQAIDKDARPLGLHGFPANLLRVRIEIDSLPVGLADFKFSFDDFRFEFNSGNTCCCVTAATSARNDVVVGAAEGARGPLLESPNETWLIGKISKYPKTILKRLAAAVSHVLDTALLTS